jgi:hypothetical protein
VTEQHDEHVSYDEPAEQHDEHVSYDEPAEQHDEHVSYDEPAEQHDAPDDRPAPEAMPSDGADPRVAAAVARLDGLGDTPPAEHVEVYEDVHRVLQDALADAARPQEQPGHEPAEPR